jgi:cell cycle checkpoint protein
VFDEYTYTPTVDADTDEAPSTTFELPLTALVDCLNIFGTAGAGAMSSASLKRGKAEEADVRDQSRLPQFFGGDKGTTGLRMGYAGAGWPLTLSMWVTPWIYLIRG